MTDTRDTDPPANDNDDTIIPPPSFSTPELPVIARGDAQVRVSNFLDRAVKLLMNAEPELMAIARALDEAQR